jgi:hypothetical protein
MEKPMRLMASDHSIITANREAEKKR